jgi:hypothetical protein
MTLKKITKIENWDRIIFSLSADSARFLQSSLGTFYEQSKTLMVFIRINKRLQMTGQMQ